MKDSNSNNIFIEKIYSNVEPDDVVIKVVKEISCIDDCIILF